MAEMTARRVNKLIGADRARITVLEAALRACRIYVETCDAPAILAQLDAALANAGRS